MHDTLKAALFVSTFLAVTWWTYDLHGSPRVGIDDANICFSYAQNFAAGHGFTYAHNPARVEGFTSLLWTLICALVFRLGLGERAVLFVSIAVVLLTQWILLRTVARFASGSGQRAWPYQALYAVLVVSSPAYVTWTTITLMDVSLWGLIVAGMACAAFFPPASTRGRLLAAVPFVSAPLTRPESLLIAPALLALLWIRARASGPPRADRFCTGILGATTAVTAAVTAFRLAYFGHPLPNTYYAKVSPSLAYNLQEGTRYLAGFVRSGPVVLVCLIVVLFLLRSSLANAVAGIRTRTVPALEPHQLAAVIALVLLVPPVLTGGDHFNMFRFFQPAYPLLCLALTLWLVDVRAEQLVSRAGWSWGVWNLPWMVAVGTLAAYGLYAFPFRDSWREIRNQRPIEHEFRIAERGMATGTALTRLLAASGNYPRVGVITAGGIARTYPGPIVDLLGLTSEDIAHFEGMREGLKNHASFDKEAFFLFEPHLLLAPPTPWMDSITKGLFTDSRFTTRWSYGVLSQRGDPGLSVEAFYRDDYLDEILDGPSLEFRAAPGRSMAVLMLQRGVER